MSKHKTLEQQAVGLLRVIFSVTMCGQHGRTVTTDFSLPLKIPIPLILPSQCSSWYLKIIRANIECVSCTRHYSERFIDNNTFNFHKEAMMKILLSLFYVKRDGSTEKWKLLSMNNVVKNWWSSASHPGNLAPGSIPFTTFLHGYLRSFSHDPISMSLFLFQPKTHSAFHLFSDLITSHELALA